MSIETFDLGHGESISPEMIGEAPQRKRYALTAFRRRGELFVFVASPPCNSDGEYLQIRQIRPPRQISGCGDLELTTAAA